MFFLLSESSVSRTGAAADTLPSTSFDGYNQTNINGQNGWSNTGLYDASVVSTDRYAFGQALRISNGKASYSFGDHTFSPALTQPAGESAQKHLEASFQIGTTSDSQQQGLAISVSPDSGQGGRMSYLRFEDQTDGVHVFFNDVTDAGPIGTPATWNSTDIVTLSRTTAYTIKFSIDFKPGPANDVVKVYVDDILEATGTTWEDYYRFDSEQTPSGNVVPTVSKMLFRAGGTAVDANLGNGFLIDNVTLMSAPAGPCTFTTNDKTKTIALVADCTTDTTIGVQDGYTLDGKGFTITAVDRPTGASFEGAVVQNDGTAMNVKNLKIEGGVPNNCVATFNGVAFMDASGSIKNVTLNNIGQTTGCQSGRAIVAWANGDPIPRTVTIEGNTVTSYNKNGIDVRGNVNATIVGNTVTGTSSDLIARNGIVVYGAKTVAQVGGNKVSGNYYTGPADTYATGLLVIDAAVSIDRKNTVFGNEVNIDNAGTISGKFSA